MPKSYSKAIDCFSHKCSERCVCVCVHWESRASKRTIAFYDIESNRQKHGTWYDRIRNELSVCLHCAIKWISYMFCAQSPWMFNPLQWCDRGSEYVFEWMWLCVCVCASACARSRQLANKKMLDFYGLTLATQRYIMINNDTKFP